MVDLKGRGCPNCGNRSFVHIGVDASFESCSGLKIQPWWAYKGPITPRVCLGCGTIYLDTLTLNTIRKEVAQYENKT